MEYRLTRTVPPVGQAVDLEVVKRHLRIDWDDDDLDLIDLTKTAAEWVETTVGRSLLTTIWRMDLACWPKSGCVALPMPPTQSVSHVKYLDTTGTLQTLDSSKYFTSGDSFCPSSIVFTREEPLPTIKENRPHAVQVTYAAGYGTSTNVPPTARQAMLMLIGHWWENREVLAAGSVNSQIEAGLASLLRTLKTGFVAGVGV